jgi:hypothetical protein
MIPCSKLKKFATKLNSGKSNQIKPRRKRKKQESPINPHSIIPEFGGQ